METSCVNIDTDVCTSKAVAIALDVIQSRVNETGMAKHYAAGVSSASKKQTIDQVDIAALCLPPVVTRLVSRHTLISIRVFYLQRTAMQGT